MLARFDTGRKTSAGAYTSGCYDLDRSGGHIVTFHIRGGALVNLVAVREVTHWVEEFWLTKAGTHELVAAYPGVHKDLRILLERTDHCFKWGLFDRDPLKIWSAGRITLLGDAAHPMLPFLGQGAAMAMEDAYSCRELARSPDHVAAALEAYEAERVPRTEQVQLAVRRQGRIFHLTSPMAWLAACSEIGPGRSTSANRRI